MPQTAKQKEWYINNKERLSKLRKNYYLENKNKVKARLKNTRRSVESRFVKSKREAITRRHIEFLLSLEEYKEIIDKPCYYCEGKMGDKVVAGIGLDRLNNDLGYTLCNVVSCCKICNFIKNNFLSSEETKVAVEAILKYRQSKQKGTDK